MTVSIIGIGLMGQALGERLLEQQQTLVIYNRSANKTVKLAQKGATALNSAQQAVSISDICLLFLSDANAINTVLDTIESQHLIGKTFIQMGTIAPDESRLLEQRLNQQDCSYLECPVLGSLPEARSGSLILMAAGDRAVFDAVLPLLNQIGNQPKYFGTTGNGSTVKLAMNQLIAGLTSSFALSLALIEKEGVDSDEFMSVVRDSALYAPTFDKKLERMLTRDFANPNFPTKHLAKDTTLFLNIAERLALNTAALEGISDLLQYTLAKGLADTDYSALYAGVHLDGLKTK
jgi:3-hydroxyisobutyrate dehydrogenase